MSIWKRIALSFLLLLGALLALGFVFHGSREPLYTIERDIEIAAPPEKVWAVLVDLAAYPDWNLYAVKVEGKPELGEQIRVTIVQEDWKQPLVVMPTITRVDRGREFGWHGSLGLPGIHETDHYFQMEPLGAGGTRLHHAEEFRGWLAWLLGSEASREFTGRAFQTMNENLKARVEATE